MLLVHEHIVDELNFELTKTVQQKNIGFAKPQARE